MNTRKEVLIVSPPGDLQIGLQALLITHLDVDVLVVGEAASGMMAIERHSPAVVVLDQNILGQMVPAFVQDVKACWPLIHCIVLANDDLGRQEMIAAGADQVVIKGVPGARLISDIKLVLNQEK